MTHPKGRDCTLVVSTYNWPQALQVCMKSIATQSVLPGEVIIADDGSTAETGRLIEHARTHFPVPLVHTWQPDEGFQLARIRNKAFAQAKGRYIIQIDGDLVLHRHFIKDHIELARPGFFVAGSRSLLDEETTRQVLQTGDISGLNAFSGKRSHFFNAVRIGFVRRMLARRYRITGNDKYYVKGCNMAFWLADLERVNGYNEAFTGWGREDSELAIRLINAGVRKQFIKTGAVCYHLYHKEATREMEQRNIDMMNQAIEDEVIRSNKGLDQYRNRHA